MTDTRRNTTAGRSIVGLLIRVCVYLIAVRLVADTCYLWWRLLFMPQLGPWNVFRVDAFLLAWTSIAVMVASIAFVAWHGARSRKSMNSNACLKCCYKLCGLPTSVCPECGTDHIHARARVMAGHSRKIRIAAIVCVACATVIAFNVFGFRVFIQHRFLAVSIPHDVDPRLVERVGLVDIGTDRSSVDRIVGASTGQTSSSCTDKKCTKCPTTSLWYGPWPVQYRIWPFLTTRTGVDYGTWIGAPKIRFGPDGRVVEVTLRNSVPRSIRRIW